MPLPDASVDAVVASSSWHWVDLVPALREVGRVLVPGGVTLLPLYVQMMLSPSVVIRPLRGEVPTIDLVLGYSRSNTSPLLKRFLSRIDELVGNVVKKPVHGPGAL